jgi:hypothetical protein
MSTDAKGSSVTTRWRAWLRSPYAVFILALVIGTFYVLTLHEGQNWSGDWSQYIHHAKNLAEGKHYLDTGYIFSGLTRFVGPYAYPPVFPILLVPVYWLKGLDLEALKLVGIICFCLTLMLLPGVLGYQLNRLQQIAIVLLTGFNPAFWDFRNNIYSDLTFMLFCYLSLRLMLHVFHGAHSKGGSSRPRVIDSCLLGIAMYLAYGTREIGFVLPLAVLTYEIVSTRRISAVSVISISIFAVFLSMQHYLLQGDLTPPEVQRALKELVAERGKPAPASHADVISAKPRLILAAERRKPAPTGHADFINTEPRRIVGRVQGYRWAAQAFWPPDNDQPMGRLNSVIFNITSVMAFIGFCLALWRKITVLEIFLAGYMAVLLLFDAPATARYLFPLFPLMLYYCVIAYQQLFASFRLKAAIPAGYLFLTTISYSHAMSTSSYDELTNGVTHPKAAEMFDFIRNHTSPSDTILFRKPRIMALLTQRSSAAYHTAHFPTPESLNRFADAVGGDYFVDFRFGDPLTHSEAPTSRFAEVFRNSHFAVYRYDQSSSSPLDAQAGKITCGDRQRLLAAGRLAVMAKAY